MSHMRRFLHDFALRRLIYLRGYWQPATSPTAFSPEIADLLLVGELFGLLIDKVSLEHISTKLFSPQFTHYCPDS